jgi:membrane associated rhomboid family serine protease
MSLIERPVAVGCLVVLAIVFGMNYVIPDCTNKLGLVTVNTMIADSQIWNIITSQFYEKSIIKLAFDILGVLVVSKATKIVGGFDQFGLFFLVCVVSCSFFTSAYCFIRFFLTGIEGMIMEPIYGFAGVFMTILTYGRQQLQNEPVIQQLPGVTYNNLPILVVFAQIIFWLVGLKLLATDIPFSIVAMLVSWSYLRFYYKFEDSNTLGDRSENFAFVAMFPEVRGNYKKFLGSFLYPVSLPNNLNLP